MEPITASLIITGVAILAKKFTGVIKDQILERAAEKIIDTVVDSELKLGDMSQEDFMNLINEIIIETSEYSPSEADRIVLEVVQETSASFQKVSKDINQLARLVDDSLEFMLLNISDQMTWQLRDLISQIERQFIQERENAEEFMTEFDTRLEQVFPVIREEAQHTRTLVTEEHDTTRTLIQKNIAKLDRILTHLGLSPDIGTESVVREEDQPILQQAVQEFEESAVNDLSELDPDMLVKTGLAHRELGEHEEARKYYQAALQIEESHRALFHLGFELFNLGRYEEAIQKFEQANKLQPKDAFTLMNWGCALGNLGRHEEAIQKFEQANKLKIWQSEILYNWGNALDEVGRSEEAIQKYQQAELIRPKDADTLCSWGTALLELGRFEEAIQKYQQADLIRPKDVTTLHNWSIAQELLKEAKKKIA